MAAVLGRYKGRIHDIPPGHKIMRRERDRLAIAILGFEIADGE